MVFTILVALAFTATSATTSEGRALLRDDHGRSEDLLWADFLLLQALEPLFDLIDVALRLGLVQLHRELQELHLRQLLLVGAAAVQDLRELLAVVAEVEALQLLLGAHPVHKAADERRQACHAKEHPICCEDLTAFRGGREGTEADRAQSDDGHVHGLEPGLALTGVEPPEKHTDCDHGREEDHSLHESSVVDLGDPILDSMFGSLVRFLGSLPDPIL
eukprot:CAMPEP_0194754756 /NCGR_PEP_ID=MMETSP0323_2-20130528/8694_1 /TAXON_ID=2866 ORGANISM="Crypthecodinium cohnii, Strain Seligo" /NCGR_SAMPLE_ID=MMETSP0323_2 /ASSEMBLY_ACC=CAM_ASM_000346 /LENGTH=217 /DNA_ID=CAMNT_0039673465 /DNA_START=15 /DNA_END=665 /DNA_ORIENTATION=+